MIVLVWLLACGSAEHSTRSAPVPATLDLKDPAGEDPVFTELEGLFVVGPAQPPGAFLDVRWGASPAVVRVVNAGLADPDHPQMDAEVGGGRVIGGTPYGYPDVRHSFLFTGDRLTSLDVSLPAKAAMPVLEAAWGAPATIGVDGEGRPVATWASDTFRVSLLEVKDRAIISFVPEVK